LASNARVVRLTRLSSIHPYPAMIANDLAMRLAKKYAQPGKHFLDPFCGTARTVMASAALGMESVGLDVNPLAVLIARAKSANVSVDELSSLLTRSTRGHQVEPIRFDLQPDRKVRWFSTKAQFELRQIVTWINSSRMSQEARLVLAALLSATTREVSYCRKSQWKLHRMIAKERRLYRSSGWDVFTRRLTRTISELTNETGVRASSQIVLGDCTTLSENPEMSELGPFDLVITSPPYGDSHTTVSYGDVSALCLGVLRHIRGIDTPHISSRALDNACLGGQMTDRPEATFKLSDYWAGGKTNEARARSEHFLTDLGSSCREMNTVLAKKADVVFVVSRRSAGGRRLYIDEFLKDTFSEIGFSLKTTETRAIVGKMTPTVVNARGASCDTVRVNTMRQELVLSFARR
jgi:site-specific DNA-methyltransferase (cytosine-N4-specific)